MRLSEPTTKIRMKILPYCRRQKCRPMTLVSGGIRFMRIFARFPAGRGRQTTVGLSRTAIFSVFAGHVFGYFRDEASLIICRYAVRCRLFSNPKMHDLEWLICVKLCFRADLAGSDRAISKNNCVKINKDRHILSLVQIFDSGVAR